MQKHVISDPFTGIRGSGQPGISGGTAVIGYLRYGEIKSLYNIV